MHFNNIHNLYEAVSENGNKDQEFAEEIITVISTSMFVEGYSTTAIEGYFQQSTDDEISEKYYQCLEHISFVDEKTLSEDVDYDLVLDEESLNNLNEVIKQLINTGRRIVAPAAQMIGKGARQKINYSGALKAVKSKTGNLVKSVSQKSSDAVKALPAGIKKTGDAVKALPAGIKKTSSNIVGKSANFVKRKTPLVGSLAVGTYLGSKMGDGSQGRVSRSSQNMSGKPVPSETKPLPSTAEIRANNPGRVSRSSQNMSGKPVPSETKPLPSTAEIRANNPGKVGGGNAGASKTDSINRDLTIDRSAEGKARYAALRQKRLDSQNASGKEIPKPRAIGKGEGEINPNSARGRMIAKNQERFGKDRIQKLRDKNAAFQAAKKKGSGYSMDDFVKDFPNSNTAKERAKRNRIPSVMDYESYDAFDIVSNYLIDSNQVDDMDEALYVMTEMDAQTIQGIVEDFEKLSK